MRPYRLNEGDILVPDEWKDTTINAFVFPSGKIPGQAEASFVITRDSDSESDDLEHYADAQLVESAKKLNRYKLAERHAMRVSDQPAMQVEYTWLTPERIEIKQRQAYLKYNGLFLVFTLTARASDFAQYEETWQQAIDSVQLRKS